MRLLHFNRNETAAVIQLQELQIFFYYRIIQRGTHNKVFPNISNTESQHQNRFLTSKLNPSHPNPGQREKINLNFYFHTSLRYLKWFCEGFKSLHKSFWATTKKYENNNLSLFFMSTTFLNVASKLQIFERIYKCSKCRGVTKVLFN